jgi:hypothetical protein
MKNDAADLDKIDEGLTTYDLSDEALEASAPGAARRATSAEQLNPKCSADTAAVVAAPRRIAKDFALSGRSYRLGVLAVRHVLASRPIGEEENQLKTAIEVHGRILSDFISL